MCWKFRQYLQLQHVNLTTTIPLTHSVSLWKYKQHKKERTFIRPNSYSSWKNTSFCDLHGKFKDIAIADISILLNEVSGHSGYQVNHQNKIKLQFAMSVSLLQKQNRQFIFWDLYHPSGVYKTMGRVPGCPIVSINNRQLAITCKVLWNL